MEVKVTSSARPLHVQTAAAPANITDSRHSSDVSSSNKPLTTNHQMTPVNKPHNSLTPAQVLQQADPFSVVVFSLFVLVVTLLCILTEDSLSLFYVLPAVSCVSVAAFHLLKM